MKRERAIQISFVEKNCKIIFGKKKQYYTKASLSLTDY